ncbi:phospholipase C/P1 nuclease domain-containing protein [Epithele typhae]|uniref:phospholipase C/P1 nuclease domain-containing protein n=1 Tax=Epithele typhae TaxID=378194 RepID=UPI0020081740|nr:phospholipase C/P1 nuclease domain-containing protein [Epithele typhae]KAH9941195.1 phospholipase C/P1 nuclease domain-containing protein [Epithele typhae]
MRTYTLTAVALVSALSSAPTAYAWGAAGHEIVATIAQIHLPRPVLNLVCDILHPSLNLSSPSARAAHSYPPCSLAPIAAWADQIRSKPQYRYTASMHYINAVDDDPPEECVFPGPQGWQGKSTANVFAALGTPQVLRALDGDMHQPLHMSGREKGGNGARVTWNGRVTNLHSVWDGLLIAQSLRSVPRNYSRPLPGSEGVFVEPHLRGAIYDGYIRRIMHEGLTVGGRLDEESRTWLECPQAPSTSEPTKSGYTLPQRVQALLGLDLASALGMTTPAGAERGWDDDVLCPYAWAAPIQKLNCDLPVWPHELDLPGTHPSDVAPEIDEDGKDMAASAEATARPPRHPDLVELDTPAYAGKIYQEWVVERLLAMAGVRLAGVLTDIFADAAGDLYA